jgi:hypothetical protein
LHVGLFSVDVQGAVPLVGEVDNVVDALGHLVEPLDVVVVQACSCSDGYSSQQVKSLTCFKFEKVAVSVHLKLAHSVSLVVKELQRVEQCP